MIMHVLLGEVLVNLVKCLRNSAHCNLYHPKSNIAEMQIAARAIGKADDFSIKEIKSRSRIIGVN